ncbi:hypothetical protein WR25_16351 isoform D [Diploscapter pachys]|nr:hypothetical protein WR25_16351 isoform D [Diploscapter pachys]
MLIRQVGSSQTASNLCSKMANGQKGGSKKKQQTEHTDPNSEPLKDREQDKCCASSPARGTQPSVRGEETQEDEPSESKQVGSNQTASGSMRPDAKEPKKQGQEEQQIKSPDPNPESYGPNNYQETLNTFTSSRLSALISSSSAINAQSLFVVLMLFSAVVIGGITILLGSNTRPLDEPEGTELKSIVKQLPQNYPTLTDENVDDLITIGKMWQSKDRNKPLCLLVTGNNGREFAIELGEQLHRFTTSWRQFEMVESTPEFTYETLTDRLEQVGDIRLQTDFDDSDAVDTQLRVFTILDIERLKWDAHKALHFFADTSSPV